MLPSSTPLRPPSRSPRAARLRLPALPAALGAALLASSCGGDALKPALDCSQPIPFTQWGQDAAHSGTTCAQGQPLSRQLADLVYDPFVAQEQAEANGDLVVHYQAPLVDGNDLFMSWKWGTYVSCQPAGSGTPSPCGPAAWSSQIWGEKRYTWQGDQLAAVWEYRSGWKPPPFGGPLNWEPVFHGVLSADSVYVPEAGGAIARLDRASGTVRATIPYRAGALDPDSYVAGPLTLAPDGSVLYNVVKLDHANPWGVDPQSWLVKVSSAGVVQSAPYPSLVPGAPGTNDPCVGSFPYKQGDPPLPPPDQNGQRVLPASFRCGPQRPGLNVAIAVGADGTLFTVSRAAFNRRYSYVVAINPDLTPKWAASLRDALNDGCNVTAGCASYARDGVDPFTNQQPAGGVLDDSSASPTALPDGSVLYGAHTGYNDSRGHLFKLSAAGKIVATYDFGWDTTPAFFRHGKTYSIVIKDNHYNTGPYRITQLDANLKVEWSFDATNTQSCQRAADGSVQCTSDHPQGFEWCVNAPVIDRDGVVYANSEDGWLYAINQGGGLKAKLFLKLALGAAYTPISLDSSGRIYTQNDGHLFVVGK